MAELFGVEVPTINLPLQRDFGSKELREEGTIRKFRIVQQEGSREVGRDVDFYNLDMVIAVGYRVDSFQAAQFRIWATTTLIEFIIKGFVVDAERLKQGKQFGADYFEELLERIREIRASERRFYLKITDIYEQCSTDDDPNAEVTQTFFKTVQNKLHWAITKRTAAEIVAERADSSKRNIGFTKWKTRRRARSASPMSWSRRITWKKGSYASWIGLSPCIWTSPTYKLPGVSNAHERLGRAAGRIPQVQRIRDTEEHGHSLT